MLNYCRFKVPFGVVEALNGNIKLYYVEAADTKTSILVQSPVSGYISALERPVGGFRSSLAVVVEWRCVGHRRPGDPQSATTAG